MKKIILLLIVLFTFSACTISGNQDQPEDENVVILDEEVTPTPEIVVQINNGNNTTPTTTTQIVTVTDVPVTQSLRPSDVPVLFEFQTTGFDMEFFFRDNQFLYYAQIQTPTPCYEIDKIVSILDSSPEIVKIVFDTRNTGEDCPTQVPTIKEVTGVVNVSRNANFSVEIDKIRAIKLYPTPTPTPIFRSFE
ncbi:hypothetical protein KC909_04585 [Candidatus Dojkabacteria bacterium]|uniref:AMIN domain-containing protein n=1 Tax=Candidatus Dojkabacteria bacterium TaxID=2099670 RepID=A0A955L663_9BACT|nr:hypothetical protein [Candidatus Dojkabacteria bacterium]